ncbi:50S ribosomal protein L31 [Metamycoplasma hyosynoviae]|uniref:Large ribosomal subunit protein bL31 n=1 Tax=Metamycoplasma hyosynoviae TaxID=29559 RepID=A0A063YDR9_9BACT|nr:50S ribosomal protein L31 [Metamycoplasma hyosynoviae]ASI54087.1 50S ribosomal protein L31 [Metamycoplasma hyosynoviae]KDE41636.1 50S ribosomal protein L31 [Metamycoplasma hyosynoviae]KDE41733.1 50S ribosomal protein L31 [Metamycoplasma hyosynoviae]KDE43869.1 50S ribosomal protein L31 [Metamycoplasma hyosynoviae]KDE44484.1 50S ribosomal protein L31 [Metamycoplasma hyosynoviae]
MKKQIHPKYQDITITCSSCNTEHKFGSTVEKASIDICSHCHPFYTGSRTTAKARGRVERFNKILEKSSAKK